MRTARHIVGRRALAALFTVGAVTVAAACGSSSGSSDTAADSGTGDLTIVASTNVWGAVAEAVAGDGVTVESLIRDPSADPHSYEASASDAAELTDADLVVVNGGGYDSFATSFVADRDSSTVVDVSALVAGQAGHDAASENSGTAAAAATTTADDHDHDHASETAGADDHAEDDHAGHDHSDPSTNEHYWYDPTIVAAVANDIADKLAGLDAAEADTYRANAAQFVDSLSAVTAQLESIAARHSGAQVLQTEPVATRMLLAAGLDDVTPGEFQNAIEDGSDPSAASLAETEALASSPDVRALVYNTQTTDAVTTRIRSTAEAAGLPIVEVTETLPDGVSFVDWQLAAATALGNALDTER
ncbi:metal ABC transporter solute-binding protein, Zn/Mn family [Millisia brevis]|uniref:metal ABC transporter solute-binding protein, Zn/Mn family n=1 Tax=Millisia brevis TaxID=264148 RepID=UPI000831A375|nr:zinc ABC transporter substrate-binding protein [Millisia brevis]